MMLIVSFLPIALFSIIAFWKPNAVLFMITGGISLFMGLSWFDTCPSDLGLAIGLCIVAYSVYCIGMAFRMLFWKEE